MPTLQSAGHFTLRCTLKSQIFTSNASQGRKQARASINEPQILKAPTQCQNGHAPTGLHELWHKVAQPLTPWLTNWQEIAATNVLFCHQQPESASAMNVSASGLFSLQPQEAPQSSHALVPQLQHHRLRHKTRALA